MSALLRSELLKQRTTRTILQLPLWMVGLVALVVLLHVFSLDVATAHEPRRPAEGARLGHERRRALRGAARRDVDHRRDPPRHDPPDLPGHAQARARDRRQSGRERARRPRDRPARRSAHRRARERRARDARHPHRAQRRRLRAAARRRRSCSGAVGGDRRRRRRDRPQPGRRRRRAVRVAAVRSKPP